MKLSLITLASILAVGAAQAATVTCDAPPNGGVPANVVGLSVSCGGLTFDRFQVASAAGNPNPEIDLVSALFNSATGIVNLSFNPNLSAPPSGGNQDLHFFFNVTGAIDQIDLSIGGQNATIIETACASPIARTGQANEGICPQGNTLANLTAYSAPPGPNQAVSAVFSPSTTTYIYKDIGVSPTYLNPNGGALTTFSQSFHVASVPEPMSMALTGSGLLAAALLRRRTRRS